MARTLTFDINGASIEAAPIKLDRRKLYGWAEMRALTPEGKICHQGGVNSDGVTLVEPGCTKTGLITADGQWTDHSQLLAFNSDGSIATRVESSFSVGIVLDKKASVEDLLNLKVLSVYQLAGADAANLKQQIGNDIYSFPFSYSAGYEHLAAFIFATDSSVFILAGTPCEFDYLSLGHSVILECDEDFDLLDDELDFSMM